MTTTIHVYIFHDMGKKLGRAVLRALDVATWTLEGIAISAGLSRDSLQRWRRGDRSPEPDSAQRIARALRRKARELDAAADRIESEINNEGVDNR